MSKPIISNRLSRLGYDWQDASPEDVAETLKKVGASCYILEVYASNDKLYRTLHIDANGAEIELGPFSV